MVSSDPNVCANCFSDDGLTDFIEGAADSTECSFCGATSDEPIAAPVADLIDHMRECLSEYYDYAVNHLPYESREGGYQGVYWDTYDLIQDELELEFPNDKDDRLFYALMDGLGQEVWCEASPFSLSPNQRLHFSWTEFCNLIKHERRFFFLSHHIRSDDELIDPASVLGTISSYAQKVDLLQTLPSGCRHFRARYQRPNETLETAFELGPPPTEGATQSNRMSPPGIVMFYVSDDSETALRETATGPADFVIAEFETTREMRILDLADLPPVPTIFQAIPDTLEYNPREVLIFLHEIAREISKRIDRDDRVHVEYVPTQVVTEYFRTVELEDGGRLDGVRYSSSRHLDHASLVLFADQRNLIVPNDQAPHGFYFSDDRWISLVDHQNVTVTDDLMASW